MIKYYVLWHIIMVFRDRTIQGNTHGPKILVWAPKLLEKMPIPLLLNIEIWQSGPLSQIVSLYPCYIIFFKLWPVTP